MDKSIDPILIVEDLRHVREMLEITLKFKGYEVVTASNGADALRLLATVKPALIITDILMPQVDGFSLVHQIRRLPNLRDVPVIFLSATYTQLEDYEFAQKLGADRYLKKPYDVNDLLLSVDEILSAGKKSVPPLEDEEFRARHVERLQEKLTHKTELISRMRRLLSSLPEEQRSQFEALLQSEIRERDVVEAELAAARGGQEDQDQE
ncbi:MAG: response regulator [Anaerolineae bacterium]|nr:response regulator [Anaerolineae bacterium]